MNILYSLLLGMLATLLNGCESSSVAVAVANTPEATTTVSRKNIRVVPLTDVASTDTQARLWLCRSGHYLYDTEDCDCFDAGKRGVVSVMAWESLGAGGRRLTIQDAVKQRYKEFAITKVERTEEPYIHWASREPLPLYYVSLRRP